jgi:hypothetical protein
LLKSVREASKPRSHGASTLELVDNRRCSFLKSLILVEPTRGRAREIGFIGEGNTSPVRYRLSLYPATLLPQYGIAVPILGIGRDPREPPCLL